MSGRWPGSGRLHAALCVARRLPAARPSTRHCPTWYSRRGRRRLMRWCFPPLGSPPRLLWAAQCGAHWQPGTRAARWVQRTCISACGAGCVCLTRCDRCAVLAASACSACGACAVDKWRPGRAAGVHHHHIGGVAEQGRWQVCQCAAQSAFLYCGGVVCGGGVLGSSTVQEARSCTAGLGDSARRGHGTARPARGPGKIFRTADRETLRCRLPCLSC